MADQPSDGVGVIPDEPVAPAGAWLNPKRGLYPEGAPLITEAPPDDSPLAYSEDEIVALWTQIYHILIKIRHFKECEVIFPSEDTGRHPNIDRARFRDEFGMSDRAISLVERLPYTVKGTGGYWGQIFFPEARIFDYLNFTHSSGMSVDCRQPHPGLADSGTVEFPPDRLLFQEDVALLDPVDWQGVAWILDTKTNAIRVLHRMTEQEPRTLPPDFREEQPGGMWHYRNWPAFHAPFVLKRYIRDLWSLRVVPLMGQYVTHTDISISDALVARVLKTRYGWPDAFRADAWEESVETVWELAQNWEQCFTKDDPYLEGMKAILKRWGEHPEEIPDLFEDSAPGNSS